MKIKTLFLLLITHLLVGAFGFGLGIYVLPILTAPPAPSEAEVAQSSSQAEYTSTFRRDLEGSDAFHWGEGTVSVGSKFIALMGEISPGPDYKLYLSPQFVETEADFNRLKSEMTRVGDIKTFKNFVLEVPANIDISQFTSVIIWCESFGEFITAAKYR